MRAAMLSKSMKYFELLEAKNQLTKQWREQHGELLSRVSITAKEYHKSISLIAEFIERHPELVDSHPELVDSEEEAE
ncbi:MAG: hypothetical protein NZ957_05765 [Thaumarchaeota archaeon]|nr:hypothetical protein [Candidatus Calditenuaceae archaeon]